MSSCVIFGGAGFVGSHLVYHLLQTKRFSQVHLADIRPIPPSAHGGVSTSLTDVRQPIRGDLVPEPPEWIFNLAAVHREPGHEAQEFFDTNLSGARNVCDYAEEVGCRNLYFTSSISVYGTTNGPTSEKALICPNSPYGASKYPSEVIHEMWRVRAPDRRLVVCRPGVVYGPGDPGNILRMIRAIKRGYFVFPGSPSLYKSYGYIYGLLDSIDFVMRRAEPLLVYNYVESPTEPVGTLVAHVKGALRSRAPVLSIPMSLLLPAAHVLSALSGGRTPVHPTRVRKAGTATHIVPQTLLDMGFIFRYPFRTALEDWKRRAPEDFA